MIATFFHHFVFDFTLLSYNVARKEVWCYGCKFSCPRAY